MVEAESAAHRSKPSRCRLAIESKCPHWVFPAWYNPRATAGGRPFGVQQLPDGRNFAAAQYHVQPAVLAPWAREQPADLDLGFGGDFHSAEFLAGLAARLLQAHGFCCIASLFDHLAPVSLPDQKRRLDVAGVPRHGGLRPGRPDLDDIAGGQGDNQPLSPVAAELVRLASLRVMAQTGLSMCLMIYHPHRARGAGVPKVLILISFPGLLGLWKSRRRIPPPAVQWIYARSSTSAGVMELHQHGRGVFVPAGLRGRARPCGRPVNSELVNFSCDGIFQRLRDQQGEMLCSGPPL